MKCSCSRAVRSRGAAGGDVHQHADDGRPPVELGAIAEDFQLDLPAILAPAAEGVVGGVGAVVEAPRNGLADLAAVFRHDQRGGAEAAADFSLRIAEHLRKARIGVAEQIVLDDVDADQCIADQAGQQLVPLRAADLRSGVRKREA